MCRKRKIYLEFFYTFLNLDNTYFWIGFEALCKSLFFLFDTSHAKRKFSFFSGSDGVWDAMINQDMIGFVRQRLQSHSNRRDKLILSQLCEQILDMCCAKTVGRYGKNSCDNMTIIIIWFDHTKTRHPTHHPGDRSETGSSVVSSCVSR